LGQFWINNNRRVTKSRPKETIPAQLCTELAAIPSPAAQTEELFQLEYKEELQQRRRIRRDTIARMLRNRPIGIICSCFHKLQSTDDCHEKAEEGKSILGKSWVQIMVAFNISYRQRIDSYTATIKPRLEEFERKLPRTSAKVALKYPYKEGSTTALSV